MNATTPSRKNRTPRTEVHGLRGLLIAIVLVVVLSACGSDMTLVDQEDATTVQPASETTEGPAPSESPPAEADLSVDNGEYTTGISAIVDEMNDELMELSGEFQNSVLDGPERIGLDASWHRDSSQIMASALTAASEISVPAFLADGHQQLVDSLEAFSTAAADSAVALEAEQAELTENWDNPSSGERLSELQDPVWEAGFVFREACLALSEQTVATSGTSIDCLGQSEESDAQKPQPVGQLGEFTVTVADDAGLSIAQKQESWIEIESVDSEEFWVAISETPGFFDPDGDSQSQRVVSVTGWPDDLTAWAEAIGGVVLAEGTTTVGDFDAQYWEVLGDVERMSALGNETGAIAAVTTDGTADFASALQINDGFALRIYRIDLGEVEVLGLAQGLHPGSPADADLPPFVPRSLEVWEWVETVAFKNVDITLAAS